MYLHCSKFFGDSKNLWLQSIGGGHPGLGTVLAAKANIR